MPDPTCPKCRGEMEDGFLVDHTYGTAAASEWVEGPVEASFWTGVKLRGRERRRVNTWRCLRCGYLESYAT
jgi:predicted nucleic-acid-binding Zn-ribbon protein